MNIELRRCGVTEDQKSLRISRVEGDGSYNKGPKNPGGVGSYGQHRKYTKLQFRLFVVQITFACTEETEISRHLFIP